MNVSSLLRSTLAFAFSFTGAAWAQRTVSIAVTGNQISGSGTAAVVLASQGNENAVGFSVTFNPAVLRYDSYAEGTDTAGGTALVNVNDGQKLAGKVGVGIARPANTTFSAGSRQLVVLTFTVLSVAASAAISFGDTPILREVSDVSANTLTATFNGAAISTSIIPKVWTGGGGDNNWLTGANWHGGTTPANDGSATLQFAGSTQTLTQY